MTRRFINRLRENENVIEVYQMMERSLVQTSMVTSISSLP